MPTKTPAFLSSIIFSIVVGLPAQAAIFSPLIAEKCGITAETFTEINRKNEWVQRNVAEEKWLEICGSLRAIGISDPAAELLMAPSLLSVSQIDFETQLDNLKRIGFANPLKIVRSAPAILSYHFEKILSRKCKRCPISNSKIL
jgi:hypothetical protein